MNKNNQNQSHDSEDKKSEDLAKNTKDGKGKTMTTNQGVKVNDTNNSLKAVSAEQPY